MGKGVSGEISSEPAGRDRLCVGGGACCEGGTQRRNEPAAFSSQVLLVIAPSRRMKGS